MALNAVNITPHAVPEVPRPEAAGFPLPPLIVAQAVSPGTPSSTSSTGRPPQRQEDLNFKFFDEQTGQTVTVTQPLWKDDNWNLGGYFTVGRNGVRRGINGWSPAAASGQNAREVVLEMLNEGLIDPRNVTITQTHVRQFGGDGGQYWIPINRQTYQDGTALFHAQRAAQIPTDSSVTIRPNDNPDFARGYREAASGDRVMSGYALFQSSLAVLGTVVAPINTARIQGRGNFEIVNPDTGQRLSVSSNPGTGGIQGTLYDRNGKPLAQQTTVGRDFTRTVTVTPNRSNTPQNVDPGALAGTARQSTVPPGSIVAERRVTVAGAPIVIRSATAGGASNFTAILGGRQVPQPDAVSFEQATEQVTALARQGRLPGIQPPGPVVTESPLTLSSGAREYQFIIRNTQHGGQSAYTLHYRIGGQDQAFRLDGARDLPAASQQVTSAFNNGTLPGIVSGGPTITDSQLTLSRGDQNFAFTVRNTQGGGQSLYTVRYRIGGQDHEYSLHGARTLNEATQQVADALNGGSLPGVSSQTRSDLTLTGGGRSYRVAIENVQIGREPNYTVSYRISGQDHAFTLPGVRTLSEATQRVNEAFDNGNLPGLTRPRPQQQVPVQETPLAQQTPQPSTVGAMSAGDVPQPSLTSDQIASATDLTQRFLTLSEARAYAETRPNNEIFFYTDRPGSPEGDGAVYFRGGQEVQLGVTPSASVDTSQPSGAGSNSATRVGNGGGDVVAGPTDAGNGGGLPPTGNGPGAAGSSGRGDADPRVAMGTRVNRASIRTVEAANVSDVSVARGADGRVEPVQFILRTPVPRSDRFTERLVTITSGDRLTDAEVTQLRASVISGNTHTYNARQNAQIDADLRRAEVVVTVQNLEARPGGAEGELTVTGAAAQASVRRNPAQPGVAETSYVQLVVSGEGTTGARMEALPEGASSLFPDRGTPQLRYGVPGGARQAAEILVRAMDQLGMPPSAFYNTWPGERLPDSRVSDLYVGIKPDSLVTFPGLLPDGRIRHYVLERNPDGSWPEGYRPPNPETGERALWAGQEVIPPPSSRPIEEGGVPIRPGRQLPPASDGTPGSQNVPGDGRGTPGSDGGAGTDPNSSGSITSGTSPGAKPSRPARFDASSSDEFKQQLRQDVSAKLSGSTAVPDNIRDEVASAVYNEALRRAQNARSPEAAAAIAQRYLDELGTQPQTLKLVVDRAERGRRQAVEGLATQFVRDHGFRNQDRRQVLSEIRTELQGRSVADAKEYLERYRDIDKLRLLAGRAGVPVPDPNYRPSALQELTTRDWGIRVVNRNLINQEMESFTDHRGWTPEEQQLVQQVLAPETAGKTAQQVREHLAVYSTPDQLSDLARRSGVREPTPRGNVRVGRVTGETVPPPRSETVPDATVWSFNPGNTFRNEPQIITFGFGEPAGLPPLTPSSDPRLNPNPPVIFTNPTKLVANFGRWEVSTLQAWRSWAIQFAGDGLRQIAPDPVNNLASGTVRLTENVLDSAGQAVTTVANGLHGLTDAVVPPPVRELVSNVASFPTLLGRSARDVFYSDGAVAFQTTLANAAALGLMANVPNIEPYAGQFNGTDPTLNQVQSITFAPTGAYTAGLALRTDTGGSFEARVGVMIHPETDVRQGLNRFQFAEGGLSYMSTQFARLLAQSQFYAHFGVNDETLPFVRYQVTSQLAPIQAAGNPPGMVGTAPLPSGQTGSTFQTTTQGAVGTSSTDFSGITVGPASLLTRQATAPQLISGSSNGGRGAIPINSVSAIIAGNPAYLSKDPVVMENLRQFRNSLPPLLQPLHDMAADLLIPNLDAANPTGWHAIKSRLDVPVVPPSDKGQLRTMSDPATTSQGFTAERTVEVSGVGIVQVGRDGNSNAAVRLGDRVYLIPQEVMLHGPQAVDVWLQMLGQ